MIRLFSSRLFPARITPFVRSFAYKAVSAEETKLGEHSESEVDKDW